jgi:hypothetical protein
MSSILHIACRIQTAVKAYNSVKEYADREKWKAHFENEKVCPLFSRFIDLMPILNKTKCIRAFQEAKAAQSTNQAPKLHPLAVALAIVLGKNEDFSLITEDHPDLLKHKYYDASAHFPDLSPFLPAMEDCWWVDLGASHFSYLDFTFSP